MLKTLVAKALNVFKSEISRNYLTYKPFFRTNYDLFTTQLRLNVILNSGNPILHLQKTTPLRRLIEIITLLMVSIIHN